MSRFNATRKNEIIPDPILILSENLWTKKEADSGMNKLFMNWIAFLLNANINETLARQSIKQLFSCLGVCIFRHTQTHTLSSHKSSDLFTNSSVKQQIDDRPINIFTIYSELHGWAVKRPAARTTYSTNTCRVRRNPGKSNIIK